MDSSSPILNNPYEEPRWHYDADLYGNLDYDHVLDGRRPYSATIGIMPEKSKKALFSNEEVFKISLTSEVLYGDAVCFFI